jgi:hypothetical protein
VDVTTAGSVRQGSERVRYLAVKAIKTTGSVMS